MPVFRHNQVKSPWYQRDGHLQTIVPALSRGEKLSGVQNLDIQARDGFLIEAELYRRTGKQLAVLLHGLEGNSRRYYMTGMGRVLLDNNIDVLCWNYRSCGKRIPESPNLYHAGFTDDLHDLVEYCESTLGYNNLLLLGFSVGGNICLKYSGEMGSNLSQSVKAVIGVSVPCDLQSSATRMTSGINRLYAFDFLRTLKRKVELLSARFPEIVCVDNLKRVTNIEDFDHYYTAPLNGFSSAKDYYSNSSCIHYLEQISVPVYILNADNDPHLGDLCYPLDIAANSDSLFLEISELGGHVGFEMQGGNYWHEQQTLKFIKSGYEFSGF